MDITGSIRELSQETIDKIAAGEVVERPASVVKELVENAIDAGASAITIEIRDGGTSLIRVTDNGAGIAAEDVPKAFLRHATSKITTAEDLLSVSSLGFRGEALSSIAAVAKVEMITKRADELIATHYVIEGAKEISCDELGAPDGTSVFVRSLFFNTPARRKFLKSPVTEGNYISEIVDRLALSNPFVSFRFLNSGTEKLLTAGNGKLFDVIYEIYGKQITKELIPISAKNSIFSMEGFIGAPVIHRGNRAFESFFVGGRHVKSRILQSALEDGFEGFVMAHQYPFCVLNLNFEDETCDVNVHPTKQDVRFFDEKRVYEEVSAVVKEALNNRQDIAEEVFDKPVEKAAPVTKGAEPFEESRLLSMKQEILKSIESDSVYSVMYDKEQVSARRNSEDKTDRVDAYAALTQKLAQKEQEPKQLEFLSSEAYKDHRIIGQVFGTYWIVEYDGQMYIIDQHAAHEKVLYEEFMERLKEKEMTSQMISPPVIVTLSFVEEEALRRHDDKLKELGFGVSHFGGKEYAIDAVPGNLYNIDPKELFMDIMAMLASGRKMDTDELIKERIASMSCKAAVKGNSRLSLNEVEALIKQLLKLDNPYHCPHGRPTIISMSKYELDKKFKRTGIG